MHFNNPMYKHFLITRFNIRDRTWQIDKNQKSIRGSEWLADRFDLFERFCFPSIRSQRSANFIWLVFFDAETPPEFRAAILAFERSCNAFRSVFIESVEQLIPEMRKQISQYVTPATRFIITTRLDNDDSLHPDAMGIVLRFAMAHSIRLGIIDMTRGVCLQVQPSLEIRSCVFYSSPFISLVEPFEDIARLQTVMARMHEDWFYRFPTYEMDERPLWIQVVHEKNMDNQMHGRLAPDKDILSEFVLTDDFTKLEYRPRGLFFNHYVEYPVYRLKKYAKKLKYKLRSLVPSDTKRLPSSKQD